VIPKGTQVRGVTTIGDQLFVARNKSSDVEVYNIQTYVLARTIQVPGCFPCDMTSVLPSVLFIRLVIRFYLLFMPSYLNVFQF